MSKHKVYEVVEWLDLFVINNSKHWAFKKDIWKIKAAIKVLEEYIDWNEDPSNFK